MCNSKFDINNLIKLAERESSKPEDWDKKLMELAQSSSLMSKCAAKQVGCVIAEDNRVIYTGINGTPSKHINCNSVFKKFNDKWYSTIASEKEEFIEEDDNVYYLIDEKKDLTHNEFSKKFEVHAEANAICRAAHDGRSIKGTTMYTNYSPCYDCAKMIIAAGIKRVCYTKEYDDCEIICNFLKMNKIQVDKIE